jgi:hypothetical protein
MLEVKLSKITRDMVVFKNCHFEGILAFQHKLRRHSKNKIKLEFLAVHGKGRKVATFQPKSLYL